MQKFKRNVDQAEVGQDRVDHSAALKNDNPGIIAHQEADHKGKRNCQ